MKIADILASKGSAITTIKPSETVAALARLLREKHVGAAVVSTDGAAIDGVITERDICRGLAEHGAALADLPVSALMTENVIRCAPGDDAARVASTMLSRGIRHMPVEQDGRFAGMMSIRDILKERLNELQQRAAMLHGLANKADRPSPPDRE